LRDYVARFVEDTNVRVARVVSLEFEVRRVDGGDVRMVVSFAA
jgi:hypothetical protein